MVVSQVSRPCHHSQILEAALCSRNGLLLLVVRTVAYTPLHALVSGLKDVRVQGYGEQELHSLTPEAHITGKYEYEQSADISFLGSDRQGVVLTYPEGEADAVTITERDMEGLRPTEYLSDNIINFYIK